MEKENKFIQRNDKGEIIKCSGSFKIGTACAVCERCKERGYTVEDQQKAREAEKERTKDLPADRVKKPGYENTQAIRREFKEDIEEAKQDIKEDLKPELKEEIKKEIQDEENLKKDDKVDLPVESETPIKEK